MREESQKIFRLNVKGADKLSVTEKNYFILVEAEHSSTEPTYVLKQINVGSNDNTIIVTNGDWKKADGSAGDRFTGNEALTYYLIESSEIPSLAEAINGEKYGSGDKIVGTPCDFNYITRVRNDDVGQIEITDYLEIRDTEDFLSELMGQALYYGIVADKIDQYGHLQTNFAVNEYTTGFDTSDRYVNFDNVRPDLASNPGTLAIGKIADGKILNISIENRIGAIPIIIDSNDADQITEAHTITKTEYEASGKGESNLRPADKMLRLETPPGKSEPEDVYVYNYADAEKIQLRNTEND